MRIWLILLLVLVSGCATAPKGYWYSPNKTAGEARKDLLQCEGEAHAAVSYQHGFSLCGFKVKGKEGDKRITVVDECSRRMKERGYEFVEEK
jgi:hypothetical protein